MEFSTLFEKVSPFYLLFMILAVTLLAMWCNRLLAVTLLALWCNRLLAVTLLAMLCNRLLAVTSQLLYIV